MILHDLVTLPVLQERFDLAEYAILAKTNEGKLIKMAQNGKNLFSWIINEDDFSRKKRCVRFVTLS